MKRSHYDTLVISHKATSDEVRSAYRRIALKHHPDQSKDPRSSAIFLAATAAYEVLGDAEKRAAYDAQLDREERRDAERRKAAHEANVRAQTPPPRSNRPPQDEARDAARSVAASVARLSVLFSQGRHAQAETLARQILHDDSRQPIPYAILGDLARAQGNVDEAARLYAYAAQFDPRNPIYQRRYEELLSGSRVVYGNKRTRLEDVQGQPLGAYIAACVVALMAIYVAVGQESPMFPRLDVISTWTFGLLLCLFLGGVALGVGLGVSRLLDRFSASAVNAMGRIGQVLALAGVAMVSYWVAAALYVALGFSQRAFSFTLSRFMFGVGAATSVFALAAAFSGHLSSAQVFLWGGNVIYIGALFGWMVADAFKS